MISDVWGALLLAMHLVGVAATAYLLMLRLLRQDKDAKCVWVLQVHSAARARDRLYALHMRRTLLGESDRCAIVALDQGVAEAERKELLRFCASVPHMYCCKSEELPSLLQTDLKEQK